MLDWRAVTGTSFVHTALAVVLAGIFAPLPFFTCMDCGEGWIFGNPAPVATYTIRPSVMMFPVEALPRAIIRVKPPAPIFVRKLCPEQPPVDRLPTLLIAAPPDIAKAGTITACIHLDANGRPDSIRLSGHPTKSAKAWLQRLLVTSTFTPAYRGGVPVGSWIEL